jgi:hypothetical protein
MVACPALGVKPKTADRLTRVHAIQSFSRIHEGPKDTDGLFGDCQLCLLRGSSHVMRSIDLRLAPGRILELALRKFGLDLPDVECRAGQLS